MADLSYDLSITGINKLKVGVRAIEQELNAHARRVDAKLALARGTRGSGGMSAGQARADRNRELKATFRGFEEIGKAAAKAERQRHTEAMRNIRTEETAKRRAIQNAAKEEQRRRKQEIRDLQQQQRAARAARASLAQGAAGSVMGATGRTLGFLGGMTGLAGGAAVYSALDSEMANNAAMADLANQGFRKGGPSRADLKKQIKGVVATQSLKSGRKGSDLIELLQSFTNISGDLDGAIRLLPQMAELADASGAAGTDIGASLATTLNGVKLKGGNLSDAQAEERAMAAMRVMAGQGKVGSVELADLANGGASRIVAAATQYGGDFEKNMGTLGGLAQMAMGQGGGASSPAEAFMAISRLSSDAVKHQKALTGMGVDVFTDKSKTQLNTPDEILFQAIHKSKGDLTKLNPIFGERSVRAMNPLAQTYTEAGGGAAGLKAMREMLGKFTDAAMSKQEVTDSATARRAEADREAAKVTEQFKRAVGDNLLPVLTEAMPKISAAIPKLVKGLEAAGKLASWAVNNPLEGIGAIIAAQVSLDIAKAGIGEVIKKMIMSAPGGGGGGGAIGTLGWVAAGAASTKLALDAGSELASYTHSGRGTDRDVRTWDPLKDRMGGDRSILDLLAPSTPWSKNSWSSRAIDTGFNAWRDLKGDAHDQIKQQMIWKEKNDANEEIVRDKRSFWGMNDNATGANPWSGVGSFGIDRSGYGTTSDQELSERRRKQEEALEAGKNPAQVASEATAKAMVGLQKEIANAQAALGELAKNAKDFPSGKGPDRGGNPIFPW